MMLASKFNNLALIPARSGSEGLRGKNIKPLLGKPMLAYTIDAAIQSQCFDKVIVSTDEGNIVAIAQDYGAEVPYLRAPRLASATANIVDVILDVLSFFEKKDIFFETFTLLQPTSPLRNAKDISAAMALFKEKNASSIVSVCEANPSPLWMNTLPEDQRLDHFVRDEIINKRRQDLQTYYRLNGAIYIARVDSFKKTKTFYAKDSYAYIMPVERSVDVDDLVDFYCCEMLMSER